MSESQPRPPAERIADLDTALAREALRRYSLELGTEVTVRTLAPGYALRDGVPLVTSVTVIGTVVSATPDVLVLRSAGTRHRIPWRAVADIFNTPPAHPGL